MEPNNYSSLKEPTAVTAKWKDTPYAANLQHMYDVQSSRPISAPYTSKKTQIFNPKLPPSIDQNYTRNHTTDRIYSNQNPINYINGEMLKLRPNSAVNSDSYFRRKYSFDERNKNVVPSKIIQESKNSSSISKSIIERVVNYGKDTPNYLLPRGFQRASSAGSTRNNKLNNKNTFRSRDTSGKDKQLAMMYAEELIEKLDSVIIKYFFFFLYNLKSTL